jgi:hypothetical protein
MIVAPEKVSFQIDSGIIPLGFHVQFFGVSCFAGYRKVLTTFLHFLSHLPSFEKPINTSIVAFFRGDFA